MTPRSIIFIISFIAAQQVSAQILAPNLRTRMSFGITGGLAGYDSRLGVEVTVPAFLNRHLAIRVKGHRVWAEQYRALYDRNVAYYMTEIDLLYATAISARARLFAEAGPGYIIHDKRLSEKSALALIGTGGVELFVINTTDFHMSYYFAGGLIFSKAVADRVETGYYYGKGLIFNTGFRFYF